MQANKNRVSVLFAFLVQVIFCTFFPFLDIFDQFSVFVLFSRFDCC